MSSCTSCTSCTSCASCNHLVGYHYFHNPNSQGNRFFFFFFSISSPSPSPSPSPSFFFFFLLFSSAKNSLQVKEMESVMACCVCSGKMREPIKTLPCLHSACLQCLKSYAAKSLRDHHDQEADSSCNAAITISMEMEEED